ncbi:hypothetical protein D3C76_1331950 [compost metagenome]
MQECFQTPVFRGLSDSLQCAIDIQNEVAVSEVLLNAEAAYRGGDITTEQFDELKSDAQEEGYEFL